VNVDKESGKSKYAQLIKLYKDEANGVNKLPALDLRDSDGRVVAAVTNLPEMTSEQFVGLVKFFEPCISEREHFFRFHSKLKNDLGVLEPLCEQLKDSIKMLWSVDLVSQDYMIMVCAPSTDPTTEAICNLALKASQSVTGQTARYVYVDSLWKLNERMIAPLANKWNVDVTKTPCVFLCTKYGAVYDPIVGSGITQDSLAKLMQITSTPPQPAPTNVEPSKP
jgi:hypothetical protein